MRHVRRFLVGLGATAAAVGVCALVVFVMAGLCKWVGTLVVAAWPWDPGPVEPSDLVGVGAVALFLTVVIVPAVLRGIYNLGEELLS